MIAEKVISKRMIRIANRFKGIIMNNMGRIIAWKNDSTG
jgi:hypothetical protein